MDTEERLERGLQQRGGNALAGQVSQHDQDRVAGKSQEVVEVTADLVGGDHPGGPSVVQQFSWDGGEQPALDLGRYLELLVEGDPAAFQVYDLATGRAEAQSQVCESDDGGGGDNGGDHGSECTSRLYDPSRGCDRRS